MYGDVRSREDFDEVGLVDCIIDCSVELLVFFGFDGVLGYVVGMNLVGILNCLEFVRRYGVDFVFLSISCVYPYERFNELWFVEGVMCYELWGD